MTAELKECSFCGFHSQIINKQLTDGKRDRSYFFVECGYCESEGPSKRDREEAISAWNKRQENTNEK